MSEKELSFEIGDFVQLSHEGDLMFQVSGVIHDSERLFVYGSTGEIEVPFDRVDKQFKEVSSSPPTPDLPALLKRCKEILQQVSAQKAMIKTIEQYEDYTGGEPNLGTCKTLGKLKTIADNAAALLSDIEKMEEKK